MENLFCFNAVNAVNAVNAMRPMLYGQCYKGMPISFLSKNVKLFTFAMSYLMSA